jgi:hypothetical protein
MKEINKLVDILSGKYDNSKCFDITYEPHYIQLFINLYGEPRFVLRGHNPKFEQVLEPDELKELVSLELLELKLEEFVMSEL